MYDEHAANAKLSMALETVCIARKCTGPFGYLMENECGEARCEVALAYYALRKTSPHKKTCGQK